MLCCLKPAEVPVRVKFYNIADDEKLKFAVIVARSGDDGYSAVTRSAARLRFREDTANPARLSRRPPSVSSARRPALRNSP